MIRNGIVWAYDWASPVLAALMSGFAIYVAAFGVFDNVIVSGLTVLLALLYGFVSWRGTEKGALAPTWLLFLHGVLAVAMLLLVLDWGRLMFEQEIFFVDISRTQDVLAWISFALITYLTYRFFGIPMLLVIVAAGLYILAPSAIGGGDEHWTRVAENLWFSTDGSFGRPVEVVGRIVLIYIVLGAVLQTAGAGEVLIKIAFAATGRLAGGPAHAAIVGSALFGTMSGAAVANVVSTGVFTIPVIKKVGFSPRIAGGVEAAASTGGQIMPPVMGAVAFLMADITGISYLQIIVAAAIPALMYYGSLFVMVSIEARRANIRPLPRSERVAVTRQDLLKSIAFWLPLAVIVAVLVTGRTAQNAGAYATAVAFVACLVIFPGFRHPRRWWEVLVEAGRSSATLMIVVAGIGFVIGVVNMTGVGIMFAESVLTYARSSLPVALVMVMLASLFLGMGVPTGAAYLIIAIVLGPAIASLGVPLIAAHLFVLYFAVLSSITPPVALSAFAAAPIAGAKPMETGWAAVRLAAPGFIIPFVFVYHSDILLIVGHATFGGVAWACAAFAVSTWGLATGLCGWDGQKLPLWERALRLIAGVAVLAVNAAIAIPAGIVLFALTLQRRLLSRPAETLKDQRDTIGRTQ